MKFLKDCLKEWLWLLGIGWVALGVTLHGLIIYFLSGKETKMAVYCLVGTVLWWILSAGIIVLLKKWRKYRDNKNEEWIKDEEYKKEYISEVEIENSYFGNGILIKDSGQGKIYYTGIESGFDRIFDSFGKKINFACDLYEFLVSENNLEYVLSSMEKIYKKADQIMEDCYYEIYMNIVEAFKEDCGWDERLKNEFDMDYLRKNWYVLGVSIDDESIGFSIDVNSNRNSHADSSFDIIISVDYDTLKPAVSFETVC